MEYKAILFHPETGDKIKPILSLKNKLGYLKKKWPFPYFRNGANLS